MNAEINLNEPFGYNIYQTIVKHQLKKNLEIGSWDGDGSTKCIVKAMDMLSGDVSLDCVEVVDEKCKILKARYADNVKVKVHNCSSISYHDLLYKDFEEVWNSPFNKIAEYSKELVKTWFDRDVEVMKSNCHFMDSSDTVEYDGVLIDGSEFTGYSEFKLLKSRTRVFFLDDVHNAFKCFQIHDELLRDSKWDILFDLPFARNGASAFIRK